MAQDFNFAGRLAFQPQRTQRGIFSPSVFSVRSGAVRRPYEAALRSGLTERPYGAALRSGRIAITNACSGDAAAGSTEVALLHAFIKATVKVTSRRGCEGYAFSRGWSHPDNHSCQHHYFKDKFHFVHEFPFVKGSNIKGQDIGETALNRFAQVATAEDTGNRGASIRYVRQNY
jgi:hypothetical protein